MKKVLTFFMLIGALLPVEAQQQMLTLDSCRAMALRNNKQLNIARLKQDVARNARKAMRTKYLPKVDAIGGYELFSKEISLLNDRQKNALGNLGTTVSGNIGTNLNSIITNMVQQGIITPQVGQQMGSLLNTLGTPLAQAGNQLGQTINDAFRTDTRQVWSGAVLLRQPVYMGGAIIAANKIANITEQMAANDLNLRTQTTLYNIDQAYWTVVSLREKEKLAISYRDLVKKLDSDVKKMIKEGVATRADGLKVDVKVNEAEMQITQVENGLSLAKMLLCQLCGLPLDKDIRLYDEYKETLYASYPAEDTTDVSAVSRPELKMLQNTIDISKQNTRIIRAEYLPHVALTGGYLISNPNVFNGFQRNFSGVWNVGLIVQIPVWNWFESSYKIRASKATTNIAMMELSDAEEKIALQITQSRFKVKEAYKRLLMANENIKSAEENLRCANLGFSEGVMESTDVMAAQTAWQQAQSQKIDAEVEVKLAQVNLNKALGTLQ
ncbi:TolC family protein [Hoylesella oralis]|nr:TolC family protein [Hoylesella oralis]